MRDVTIDQLGRELGQGRQTEDEEQRPERLRNLRARQRHDVAEPQPQPAYGDPQGRGDAELVDQDA